MGSFNKWSRGESNNPSDDVFVVLFVTRNKDNKELENFKERRMAFLTTRTPDELLPEFETFANKQEAFSRMYYSVNARSNAKTQKLLMHHLLDNDYNMATLPQRVASFAAQKECLADAKTARWLFDFDPVEGEDTDKLLEAFVDRLYTEAEKSRSPKTKELEFKVETHKTPNGYAVLTNCKFDTRQLLVDFPNAELKRDDLYCAHWLDTRDIFRQGGVHGKG